jgi:eukaryotic-like serine/threonine-protein kinase
MGLLGRTRDLLLKRSGSASPVLDGKYRVERLLAEGGMGAVYVASDLRLDREVAVKIVRPELLPDPAAHDRFAREAQTLARLQHPSIVTVFDFGALPSGAPYLVMELVRGGDLRRELTREGRLDAARANGILSAVCAALEAAHREGVVHGDLKPENILLPDEGVDAKVLDFGVAEALRTAGRVLDTGALDRQASIATAGLPPIAQVASVGTPAYMAPEQLRGEPATPLTDVFSLGVLAYEMLLGTLPFGSGSAAEVALAQTRAVSYTSAEPLPPGLVRAVTTALALDADRRPVTAQAFAHLVGAAAGGL